MVLMFKLFNSIWPLISRFVKIDFTKQNWYNDSETDEKKSIKEDVSHETRTTFKGLVAPVLSRSLRITSEFGMRKLTYDGVTRNNFHTGVDFGGAGPVYACEDIVIQKILPSDKDYPGKFKYVSGKWKTVAPKGRAWTPYVIAIGLTTGAMYKYKHVECDYTVGTKIIQGQSLGAAGNLGFSMGAHLHFEIWPEKNGKYKNPVNPIKFLRKYGVKI